MEESPEIDPHIYSHLRHQGNSADKAESFQHVVVELADNMEKINFDPSLTSYTHIHSRCIIDQKVEGRNMNLLEENMIKYPHYFGVGKYFLERTQEVIIKKYINLMSSKF